MPNDFWMLALAIGGVTLAAGFIHSAIGFGFGIVAISFLPFLVDARSAHVIVSISSVPMLVMAAWTYREGVEKRSLVLALLGAMIFLPIGLRLFETVSLDLLVRGTGIGILAMVLMSLRPTAKDASAQPGGWSCFAAGSTAGFLAGAVSIAGPPIAAFALKQGWSQARYKAFITQCLLVMAMYKAGLLMARNHFEGPVISQTAIAAIVSIAGVQLGAWASRGIAATRFKRLVAVALITVSIMMIVRGQKSPDETEQQSQSIHATQSLVRGLEERVRSN